MKFTTSIFATACALATMASAYSSESFDGMVEWVSQDSINRIVHCTSQNGQQEVPDFDLPAGTTVNNTFPEGWTGNCVTCHEGVACDGNGMLAEFCFNSWGDLTFFDVSSIVAPSDTNNVKMIMPAQENTPISGCEDFSNCNSVYVNSDDLQTQSTQENHFIVLVGTASNSTTKYNRRGPVRRSYVLGEDVM